MKSGRWWRLAPQAPGARKGTGARVQEGEAFLAR